MTDELIVRQVDAVLRHYLAGGAGARVSVLEWRLPVRSQMKIRTEAQFTALNDCNFRLMNRVKYAAMVVRTYIIYYISWLVHSLNIVKNCSFKYDT